MSSKRLKWHYITWQLCVVVARVGSRYVEFDREPNSLAEFVTNQSTFKVALFKAYLQSAA